MSGLTVTVGVVLLLHWARAQDANCDFIQNVTPGTVYYVYLPRSGTRYQAGVQCRWIAYCPSGYNCRADCPTINLPQSASCSVDRLLISRSGDPQLTSADYYCGTGSLSNVVSTGTSLSFGLLSSTNSPGGRFSCEVRAQLATSTPSTCNCGMKKRNRIVGGSPTQPNEFPWMAGIVYKEQDLIRCGATIISTTHVVTAGHCVATRVESSLSVVVGGYDVTRPNDSPARQTFDVQRITVHPQYAATNYQNDIAVLMIRGQIVFSDRVGPVCLPFNYVNNNFAGAEVEILGWGSTEFGGPTSNVLRKTTVSVISPAQCQASISSVTSKKICHYTPGKDACQDDSGGPMHWWNSANSRYYIVGVLSYGLGCASSSPGVNTRMTEYVGFITSSAPNSNFCRV